MIKKSSIAIMVIAILVGAGVIYKQTNDFGGQLLGESTDKKLQQISEANTTPSETIAPTQTIPTAQSTNKPSEEKGPYSMQIDTNKSYQAILKTTQGDITIKLTAKETPVTVNNFVVLAGKKFYNNTIFHRVIKGFMIQGGDPKGNGTGGPGYMFDDEPFQGEYTKGTVAMANAGPNTNGSQFFIMHADYALPKNYVIFGRVVKGIEVVDKIAESSVTVGPGGENSTPVTPATVTSVEIIEQ